MASTQRKRTTTVTLAFDHDVALEITRRANDCRKTVNQWVTDLIECELDLAAADDEEEANGTLRPPTTS